MLVTDELLDPLLACVLRGEPFVEYGVVEYRLRCLQPALFAAHVRDAGHVILERGRTHTASSVRFSLALERLYRSGDLLKRFDRATGAWSYNEQVSYWARPGAPEGSYTWAEYCADAGRSPEWTELDRRGLVSPPAARPVR